MKTIHCWNAGDRIEIKLGKKNLVEIIYVESDYHKVVGFKLTKESLKGLLDDRS